MTEMVVISQKFHRSGTKAYHTDHDCRYVKSMDAPREVTEDHAKRRGGHLCRECGGHPQPRAVKNVIGLRDAVGMVERGEAESIGDVLGSYRYD